VQSTKDSNPRHDSYSSSKRQAKSFLNLTYLIPTGAPRTIAPNALMNAPGMGGEKMCSKIKEMKRGK
jgi:hypothetical protein